MSSYQHDRLIINMEIPYLEKTVFILRRGPGRQNVQPAIIGVLDLTSRVKAIDSHCISHTRLLIISLKCFIFTAPYLVTNEQLLPFNALRPSDAYGRQ